MSEPSKNEQYKHVLKEVIETEKRVQNNIDILQARLESLPAEAKSTDVKQLTSLITNLNDTFKKNSLLESLRKLGTDASDEQKISALNDYYQSKNFTQYVKAVADFAPFYEAKGPQLAASLDSIAPAGNNNVNFSGLMIQPIQRIPRHPLLMDELHKQMGKAFPNEQVEALIGAGVARARDMCITLNAAQGSAATVHKSMNQLQEAMVVSQSFFSSRQDKVQQRQECLSGIAQAVQTITEVQNAITFGLASPTAAKSLANTQDTLSQNFADLEKTTKQTTKQQVIEEVCSKISDTCLNITKQIEQLTQNQASTLDDGFSQASEPEKLKPSAIASTTVTQKEAAAILQCPSKIADIKSVDSSHVNRSAPPSNGIDNDIEVETDRTLSK